MTKGWVHLVLVIACLNGCGSDGGGGTVGGGGGTVGGGGGTVGGGGGDVGGGGGGTLPVTIQITTPSAGQIVANGTGQVEVSVELSGTVSGVQLVSVDGSGTRSPPIAATSTDSRHYTGKVALWANANTIEADATCLDGSHSTATVQVEYPFVQFTAFQDASVVIGQAKFEHYDENRGGLPGAGTLALPLGRALTDGGKLFISDSGNHRVLVFDSVPDTSGSSASFVLGQPSLDVTDAGSTDAKWIAPLGVAAGSGALLVADQNRVLVFSSMPTQTGVAASFVEGWDDFHTAPSDTCARNRISRAAGVWVVKDKLLVADSYNHRVLVWNSIPTKNGQDADLVLGQADFTYCNANAGGDVVPGDSTMRNPTDVWSDGVRVVVADSGNNRVLVWNSFPEENGKAAGLVLGQDGFKTAYVASTPTGLDGPNSVSSNGNQLFVSDSLNNRILIWDSFPTASGAPASGVLGQRDLFHRQRNDDNQDYTPDSNPTGRTLWFPSGVALWGDQLFVTDNRNNRVLIFKGTKPTGALPLAP